LPATALVGAIAWLAFGCAQSLRRRRSNALYPCLGVAATTLVGLHALLDFSIEIPAVAVTYAAILGVACARARGAPAAGRQDEPAAWRSPHQRRGLALGALVAAALLALAVPRLVAELTGLPARVVERQLDASVTPGPGRLERAAAPAGRLRPGRQPARTGRSRRGQSWRSPPCRGCCPTRGRAGWSGPMRRCDGRSRQHQPTLWLGRGSPMLRSPGAATPR
jgi:hypothetical protein